MRVALVIDLFDDIRIKKDTSLALAYAAKLLGCSVFFIEYNQLFFMGDQVYANAYPVHRIDPAFQETIHEGSITDYLELLSPVVLNAASIDIALMRKDPPMNEGYWATTYLLQQWELEGVLVANSTRVLQNFNEKCAILHFPELITDTVVTADLAVMEAFLEKQRELVLKPLDGMGGSGVIQLKITSSDFKSDFLAATRNQSIPVMLQKVLDIYKAGDKRVFLLHGIPLPYALKRTPAPGDFRANLAVGGTGEVVELTKEDTAIADLVARRLPIDEMSLIGLDIIDGHLSEINITSPTGLREIQEYSGAHYAMDYIRILISRS